MRRKEELISGEVYHVFNKSIAGFTIFNSEAEFLRMRDIGRYYQTEDMPPRFSRFMESERIKQNGFYNSLLSASRGKGKLVQIIAYCLMPTHLHFILKQLKDSGVSLFMGNVFNSYSRYFNTKHKRKGPLWEGRFKNKLVENDEQLLHLTRYLHLNPTSVGLVNKPEKWSFSSYREYLGMVNREEALCYKDDLLDISAEAYKKFVEDRISYQRELEKIKSLFLE